MLSGILTGERAGQPLASFFPVPVCKSERGSAPLSFLKGLMSP